MVLLCDWQKCNVNFPDQLSTSHVWDVPYFGYEPRQNGSSAQPLVKLSRRMSEKAHMRDGNLFAQGALYVSVIRIIYGRVFVVKVLQAVARALN